jgi:hypothetical protein
MRLEDALRGIFIKHGFELTRDPETQNAGRSPKKTWWFSRVGRLFPTEFVSVEARWRPTTEFMITFFGSDLTLAALMTAGIEGNAGGFGLFQYQHYSLGKDPKTVLPPVITLKRGDDSGELFRRLDAEVEDVIAKVWVDLWKARSQETGGSA